MRRRCNFGKVSATPATLRVAERLRRSVHRRGFAPPASPAPPAARLARRAAPCAAAGHRRQSSAGSKDVYDAPPSSTSGRRLQPNDGHSSEVREVLILSPHLRSVHQRGRGYPGVVDAGLSSSLQLCGREARVG
jgi:hypothetical protein